MYTIIFRKGAIELELVTDDKAAVERQLDLIINQATEYSSNKKSEVVKESVREFTPEIINPQPIQEVEQQPEQPIEPVQEFVDESVTKEEPITENNNIQEPVPILPQFHHITEEEKRAVIQNADDIIPPVHDVSVIKPLTINSLQNPEPISEPDFDKILNQEMNSHNEETPVLKDEKFIHYVEAKAALEKIDFLVVTAQYLAQYENMNTFNLKHINAKLMQNFTLIVDHSVLQSAISREFITQVHQGADDVSAEYMLTEKGLRSY